MILGIAKTIKKLADGTSHTASFCAGCALIAMLLIIFFEVVMRKFLNAPTIWSIEMVSIVMLWFTFLTLATIQKKSRHVRVDLLLSRLQPQTALLWNNIPLLFTLGFVLVLVYFSAIDCWETFLTKETSSTIWAPLLWPMKLSVPLGGVVLALQLISDLVNIFTISIGDDQTCPPSVFAPIQRNSAKQFIILLLIFLLLFTLSVWMICNYPLAGLVILLFVLLFAGVPIFVTLAVAGIAGIYIHFGGSLAITQAPEIIYTTIGNFTLAALPPFILSGYLLQRSGAGEELYDLFNKWLSWLPGGLGISTILSCAFFAAISISSVATVATVGLIAIPALVKRDYSPPFSYGLVASGATLGIMIPPSGTMILYAMVTEESLGKLLIAGILPGLLLVSYFILYTLFYTWRHGSIQQDTEGSWQQRWAALRKAIWVILVPLIVILGIFSGIFTVLESGAIAAIYTLIMVLVRKKIKLRDLPEILSECGINGGFILIIIASAMIMGRFITLLQVPQTIMQTITTMQLAPPLVICAIVLLLTILGLFLEIASVMMISLPVIYPVVTSLGYNGIWFAIVMTVAMEMALITPPVGINLYVIQGITDAKLGEIVAGVAPFFLVMLAGLITLFIFPQLSLLLPSLMKL